jgi:hypothetical protein
MNGVGLSGATKRVADHARSFVRLELQLAVAEMKKRVVLLKKGAKPVPEQAIEEARLTTEAIRDGH